LALGFGLWALAVFGLWRPLAVFGLWPLAFGRWPLAFGLWPLAFGLWPLAFGLWPLAFGLWLLLLQFLAFALACAPAPSRRSSAPRPLLSVLFVLYGLSLDFLAFQAKNLMRQKNSPNSEFPLAPGLGPRALGLVPWAPGLGPWAFCLGPRALGLGPWGLGPRASGGKGKRKIVGDEKSGETPTRHNKSLIILSHP
jgi:hypothetical protein